MKADLLERLDKQTIDTVSRIPLEHELPPEVSVLLYDEQTAGFYCGRFMTVHVDGVAKPTPYVTPLPAGKTPLDLVTILFGYEHHHRHPLIIDEEVAENLDSNLVKVVPGYYRLRGHIKLLKVYIAPTQVPESITQVVQV